MKRPFVSVYTAAMGILVLVALFVGGTSVSAHPLLDVPTPTAEPPTNTPTSIPANTATPTNPPATPTNTPVPPTNTPIPPTTQPTNTPRPRDTKPTSVPEAPTATPEPTSVPEAPTATPEPTVDTRTADPAITKQVNTASARVNDIVEYTISVTNRGSAPANDVVVTDNAPAGLEVISATASSGTVNVSGNTVTVSIGTLNPGDTVTVTVRARVTAAGANLTNNASVSSSNDSDPSNNNASVSLSVRRPRVLPQTGEGDGSMPYVWMIAVIGVLGIAAGALMRRRQS